MDDQQIINEFLIESHENLSRLDREMVALEQRPQDAELLASIFRTIHTIKGTCGFLGFEILERISHVAESILSQLRAKQRELTPVLVSIILETVDAIKQILNTIEATGKEGSSQYENLCLRLEETERLRVPAGGCDAQCRNDQVRNDQVMRPGERTEHLAPREAVESAQAAGRGAKQKRNSADLAATRESVVRKFLNKPSVSDFTIRVDVGLLDRLMNLAGELVLVRNQMLRFTPQEDQAFYSTVQRLNAITSDLQESVMKTRMQPIGTVWNKLPRVVRDLAAACGKQIALEMEGSGTELDRTILEAFKDPLTHIVRNCCDHGIERPEVRVARGKAPQGRLSLRAFHEGGHVIIEIHDDGAGIDGERVKQKALQRGLIHPEQAERMSEREAAHLIFLPGLSTADQLSNISGRGVGMDVVRTNIEKVGGVVDLTSEKGSGTTLKIKIPLTLAIIPGLVITSGSMRFVIPQVSLLELIRLEGEQGLKQIERIHGVHVYRRRGQLLPLAYLNEILKLSNEHVLADVVNIVVLQAGDSQFGLVVDGISDTEEIVVKALGEMLKGVSCYAGATIMGDGKVALILDVMGIAQRSGVISETRDSARAAGNHRQGPQDALTPLLLFQVGESNRLAVPLSLVARLEEFPKDRIERAAGDLVIQYRGRILPLLSLDDHSVLPGGGQVQVIVFSDGERQAGLIVDRIIDIVDERLTMHKTSGRPGILGSAVVAQKVTDFLDLESILFNRVPWSWQSRASRRESVLVADSSSFSRGLIRSYLEMEGHLVVEADSVGAAYDRLREQTVALVLVAPELSGGGGQELLRRLRSNRALASTLVAALASNSEHAAILRRGDSAYDAYSVRTDRESILDSVRSLAKAIEPGERTTDEQRAFISEKCVPLCDSAN